MNPVEKVLSVIDDKTERYFSKKWHWAITIPVVIAILVLAYFIFCFSKEPYTTYGYRSDASRTVARCVAGVLIVLCLLLRGVWERPILWPCIVVYAVYCIQDQRLL